MRLCAPGLWHRAGPFGPVPVRRERHRPTPRPIPGDSLPERGVAADAIMTRPPRKGTRRTDPAEGAIYRPLTSVQSRTTVVHPPAEGPALESVGRVWAARAQKPSETVGLRNCRIQALRLGQVAEFDTSRHWPERGRVAAESVPKPCVASSILAGAPNCPSSEASNGTCSVRQRR